MAYQWPKNDQQIEQSVITEYFVPGGVDSGEEHPRKVQVQF